MREAFDLAGPGTVIIGTPGQEFQWLLWRTYIWRPPLDLFFQRRRRFSEDSSNHVTQRLGGREDLKVHGHPRNIEHHDGTQTLEEGNGFDNVEGLIHQGSPLLFQEGEIGIKKSDRLGIS